MSVADDILPGWRGPLARRIESPRVQNGLLAVILVNAAILGLESSPAIMAEWGTVLVAADRAILAVFVAEIALRLAVWRGRFFRDPWSVFDFVVVGIALLPAAGPFAVLRALRVLRLLRLVSMATSMRGVVSALLAALPGMASIIGLMTLVLYVSAVMATKLFGAIAPDYFGNLGATLFTLFQVMTIEGWPDIARGVMVRSPFAWIFFVAYLLIATFMVLNLFIAVIVNAMQSRVAEDLKGAEEAHTQLILDEVRALRNQLAALRAEVRAPRELLGANETRKPGPGDR
jgi:voltage-gated sodium channel